MAQPASSPLFRADALAAQSSPFLGTIRIATPPRLVADVIQDRRSIWEWAQEPLLAAKARWKSPPNDPMTTSPGGV